jgi:hypothetical protein
LKPSISGECQHPLVKCPLYEKASAFCGIFQKKVFTRLYFCAACGIIQAGGSGVRTEPAPILYYISPFLKK